MNKDISFLRSIKWISTCFVVAFFTLTGNAQAQTNCSITAATGVAQAECEALLDLYNQTNGASWTTNTNWNTGQPISNWHGVDVSGSQVTRLHLPRNMLSGEIPDLSALTGLEQLNLHENMLSGEIPDLSALTSLEQITLSRNRLSGTIPTALGNLTNLRNLWLDNNQLSGTIPDLSRLTNLEQIDLNTNQLSGGIPNLSASRNLEHLYLFKNMLSGTIPATLGNLTNLQVLSLDNNQLSGTIPDLSALTRLFQLTLSRNKLSGPIPTWLGGLTNLQYLSLWGNKLTGGIPDLSALTDLVQLSLSDNMLTGEIPATLGSLTTLYYLYLWGNELTGEIPATLGQLRELRELSLSRNMLTGEIPATFVNFPFLQYLWLNNNMLSGTIPALNGFAALVQLDLSDNMLSGEIEIPATGLIHLERLYLSGNELTGEIPDLSASRNLVQLDLSRNMLSGEIPDLSALTDLVQLDLSRNMLSGEIPATLGQLTSLERLYLTGNDLTGTIPTQLESLTTLLEELGLWGNEELTWDTISNELGKRADRAVLSTLYNLNGGEDWTNNEKWFSEEEMDIFSFSSWYGVNTDMDTGRVSGLNLSNNRLKEELTNAIEALDGLKDLNISNNRQLTGELPLRLMDLPVETLDIRCTGVATPADTNFEMWLSGITFQGTCPPPPPPPPPPPAQPLEQVMGVEVMAGVEQLLVSWDPVSEADGYKIQWKSGSQQFDSSRQHITSASTTSYTISNLDAGMEYVVRVIATKSGDDGTPSLEVAGTPSAPEPPVQQPDPDGSGGGCTIVSNGVKGNTSNSVLLNLLLMGSAMFLVVSRKGR